jgi:hypothetical protein
LEPGNEVNEAATEATQVMIGKSGIGREFVE